MERPLTQYIHPGCPPFDLREYEMTGGYSAFAKSDKLHDAAGSAKTGAGQRSQGRGGAGFNTGMKWSFVPMGDNAPRPKIPYCQRR